MGPKVEFQIKSHFRHFCSLPQESKASYLDSPYDNLCQTLIKRFRISLTVDHEIYQKQYFKSTASFNKEIRRHLYNKKYKYVIHPYSKFLHIKNVVASILFLTMYLIESIMGSFLMQQKLAHYGTQHTIHMVALLGELLLLVDLITRFREGYVETKTREIVLDPRRIRRHYLRGYFAFDVIPLIGALMFQMVRFFIFLRFDLEKEDTKRISFVFHQTHRFRLVRIRMVINHFNKFLKRVNCVESYRKVLCLCLFGYVLLHNLTLFAFEVRVFQRICNIDRSQGWFEIYYRRHHLTRQYFVGKLYGASYAYAFYLYYLHMCVVASHFLGTGVHIYETRDSYEMFYFSLVLMMGIFFFAYCLAKICQLFGVVNISENYYDQFLVHVEQYLRSIEAPKKLRKRVSQFCNYKFNKRFFSEQKILDTLSQHLQMEILLYSCGNLVKDVLLFRDLSKDATGLMLTMLKQEVYLKGDVIQESSHTNGHLYFILYGTCKINMRRRKEVLHIEDGDHFGDLSLYSTEQIGYTFTVEAVELTEVYRLEKKDLELCCKMYPEIGKKVVQLAQRKTRKYNRVFAIGSAEEDKTGDIREELRRGHILHRGMMRADYR